MAAAGFAYGCFEEFRLKETILFQTDFLASHMKGVLLSSAYTPNLSTHTTYADISAFEIANGNGYTTGGLVLTSAGTLISRSGTTVTIDIDDLVWTAGGGPIPAWRYIAFVDFVTRNAVVNPLMWYEIGDSTPTDIAATADGGNLRVRVNASGIWTVT